MRGHSRRALSEVRIRLTVGAIAIAALCLGLAAPASAIIVRLHNGHYLSYMPLTARYASSTGSSGATSGSSSALSAKPALSCANCDSINHNLDYGGGPVMTSNTNYVIAWIPHTSARQYTGTPFQDQGFDSHLGCTGDSCGYMFGVAQFFIDLAHDSGGSSNPDSVATQYNQAAAGAPAAYNSHFGACSTNCGTGAPNGVFLDTDPIPGNTSGCPDTATAARGGAASGLGGFCVTDAQIQTELNNFLTAHNLPRGLTNEYFLLTPPDVVTCEDAAGTSCSGNAPGTHAKFCGYHSFGGPANNGFLYANIPDSSGTTTSTVNDGIEGCDPFSADGDCSAFVCNYNTTLAEGSLSAVSHEHIESITDPQPPSGWNDDEKSPPKDRSGGEEIGDLCNDDASLDNLTNYQFNSGSFTDTPFNYTINGHHYWLQREWSNQGASCAHSIVPDPPPGASFIVSSQNGGHVVLNAAPSCGNAACDFNITEFAWQTDDFVQPGVPPGGPNGLVNSITCPFQHSAGDPGGCGGESFSHVFPERGTYNVALTTQTADGRSFGTVRRVRVFNAPKPRISATGSGLAGTPVHFSSAGTTHDPALTIHSYLWHFGDGTTSTAANPSHTYARPGARTVSLTVTDSQGQKGTRSGTLTVAASCRVPNVVGKTLTKAQTAIRAAGCAVGSVRKPARKTGTRLVVRSESPLAGGLVPKGTPVSLTMVWK